MGYDKDSDAYEIIGERTIEFRMNNIDKLGVTEISKSSGAVGNAIKVKDSLSISASIAHLGLKSTNAGESFVIKNNSGLVTIDNHTAGGTGDIRISTENSTNAIVVDNSTGNVGIGTTNAAGAKLRVSGDLKVDGGITATSITSSIITSSILQVSGSNIFGDAINDTHTFNGHITASGDISMSGTLTVNTFQLDNISTGNVTASGIISASGNIFPSENITSLGTITAEQLTTTDDIGISSDVIFTSDTDHNMAITQPGGNTDGRTLNISASNANRATAGASDGGDVRITGGKKGGTGDDGNVILAQIGKV